MFNLRAKSKKETDLLMYGSISEWGKVRAEDFIRNISDAKAKGYEQVNLKINSPGGSIFEGLAIISQMTSHELQIVGTVEGIAASMMSVVLQKCHKRRMVKGTMLMIHQGSGGVFGSANYIRNYADLMDSMNKILADIYAGSTKKKADWILENWMAEGKDTWFTAEQALKEGLIDEIVDGNVKPLEKEKATIHDMAAHYAQYCDTNDNKMDREQLIKELGLSANATDAEIMSAIKANKSKADEASAEDTDDKGKGKGGDTGKADLSKVVDGVVALAKKSGADEKQISAIKKLAEIDLQAAMDLIPEAKQDEPKKDTLSVNDLLAAIGKSGGSASDDRKNWSLSDWQSKDSQGLLKMAKDKPEEYCKLFKAEFGTEISVEEVKKLVTQ